jgi:hypothetical protein
MGPGQFLLTVLSPVSVSFVSLCVSLSHIGFIYQLGIEVYRILSVQEAAFS